MATVGHVAVGLAASQFWADRQGPAVRSKVSMMVFYSALALLPDIDVLAFRLHIRKSSPMPVVIIGRR